MRAAGEDGRAGRRGGRAAGGARRGRRGHAGDAAGLPAVVGRARRGGGGAARGRPLRRAGAGAARPGAGGSTYCCSRRRISTTGPARIYLGPDGRDWPDNPRALRGAVLDRGAARREGAGGWRPEVLHAHDWQARLRAALSAPDGRRCRSGDDHPQHRLSGLGAGRPAAGAAAAAGGVQPRRATNTGASSARSRRGWSPPTAITTVSPTYALELLTPRIRHGLRGRRCARARGSHRHPERHRHRARGIPRRDPAIERYADPRRTRPPRAPRLMAEMRLEAGGGAAGRSSSRG